MIGEHNLPMPAAMWILLELKILEPKESLSAESWFPGMINTAVLGQSLWTADKNESKRATYSAGGIERS